MNRNFWPLIFSVMMLGAGCAVQKGENDPLNGQIRTLSAKGEYEQAERLCEEAALKQGWTENGRARLAELYCDHAYALAREKTGRTVKCIQAIALCERAEKCCPENSGRATGMKQKLERELRALEYREAVKAMSADSVDREQIRQRVGAAGRLYSKGEYSEARALYESVLRMDPYEKQAIEGLRKVYVQLGRAADRRNEAMRAERNAESSWKEVSPVPPDEGNTDSY